MDTRTADRIGTIALNIVVAFFGILIALPLIWMVAASFKPLSEIYRYPPTLIPENEASPSGCMSSIACARPSRQMP